MTIPDLRTITIKPTFACTARCAGCERRLLFYDHKRQETKVALEVWKGVLSDAGRLGARRVIISGGEPTTYRHLPDIVETTTTLGMSSKLNTNGSCLDLPLVSQLAEAGLTETTISVYSHDSAVHDQIRNEDGLFDRATKAIGLLKEQATITVGMQTILARHSLLDLDKLLTLAYRLKVAYLQVSYVEGGAISWLPSPDQIVAFRSDVLPRIEGVIRREGGEWQQRAITAFQQVFPVGREVDFSRGNYFTGSKPTCRRPLSFAMALADGNVLPCSGSEYTNSPVMGNLLSSPLDALWRSDRWNVFRTRRHDWCHKCPFTLHMRIPLI